MLVNGTFGFVVAVFGYIFLRGEDFLTRLVPWMFQAAFMVFLYLLYRFSIRNTPRAKTITPEALTLTGVHPEFARQTEQIRDTYDYSVPIEYPFQPRPSLCANCGNEFTMKKEGVRVCKNCRINA